jgi:hypothetical protein
MHEGEQTTDAGFPRPFRFTALIPVFNDWKAAGMMLQQLDAACAKHGLSPAVLLVDDGSAIPAPEDFVAWKPGALSRIEVLELYRNLGHQRGICVGMVYLCQNSPDTPIVVMDADGEDSPDGVPLLIQAYHDRKGQFAVFAARRRRTEGLIFKSFYQAYRLLHILLLGADIRIGNFSILPPDLAVRLIRSSDLWNHYAASVVKSRLPLDTIPIDRGERLEGRSQMNFSSLALHGLSAMSVYSDLIGIRIVIAAAVLVFFGLLALIGIVVAGYTTSWAVPGWATNIFGLTLLLIFQAVIIGLLFTFGVLASRGGQSFIPIRDCPLYVLRVRRLFSHA